MNEKSPQLVSELIEVALSRDELTAVEGWRQANDDMSRQDAIRHLVRLGLLSEIGRIYKESTRD